MEGKYLELNVVTLAIQNFSIPHPKFGVSKVWSFTGGKGMAPFIRKSYSSAAIC